jgi:hypothetical protein
LCCRASWCIGVAGRTATKVQQQQQQHHGMKGAVMLHGSVCLQGRQHGSCVSNWRPQLRWRHNLS